MPSKNSIKTYVAGGYYHVYNRGVEKRTIFLDEQDCQTFLYYLKVYLSPKEELPLFVSPRKINRFLANNLSEEVDLLSFALMPNHVHLQLKQYSEDGLRRLLHRLMTSYVMYFNQKYKRVGPLFQNIYKASIVDNEAYLLELSRYIHRNPRGLSTNIDFTTYSSYPYYLGERHAHWIKPKEILSYFSYKNPKLSYKSFVELDDSNTMLPEELLLDEE